SRWGWRWVPGSTWVVNSCGPSSGVALQVRVCAAVRRPAVPAAVTDPLCPELVGTKEVVLFYVGPPVAPTPPCSAVTCTVSSDERVRVRRCSHDGHETPPTCDASHYHPWCELDDEPTDHRKAFPCALTSPPVLPSRRSTARPHESSQATRNKDGVCSATEWSFSRTPVNCCRTGSWWPRTALVSLWLDSSNWFKTVRVGVCSAHHPHVPLQPLCSGHPWGRTSFPPIASPSRRRKSACTSGPHTRPLGVRRASSIT